MSLLIRTIIVLLIARGALAAAFAQEQQPDNIALENSDAIAGKLFTEVRIAQTGDHTAPLWAYEVDFNLDGFSELYGYVNAENCDGRDCGLFLYVLEGDHYREVLGDIPGARLTATDKVFLGSFKRNGFIDLQLDQMLVSWTGDHYAAASGFPATALDGGTFLAACQKSKSNETPEEGEAETVASDCQCALDRFQTIGFAQSDLDNYAGYLANTYEYPAQANAETVSPKLRDAEDVGTGCDIASGKIKWEPASFVHGDQPQSRLDFDGFIDACVTRDWIVGHRKIGSPDRALGLCGCLAREIPTYGVSQDGLDLITRYYRGDIADTDVDAGQPDLLTSHDAASEACLREFPAK